MRYFEVEGIHGTHTVPDYFQDYRYDARMEELGGYDRMRPPGKQHAAVMQQITQPHHNDVLMGRGGKCSSYRVKRWT